MPELPEVETIARGLGPRVVGRRIDAVVVRERRLRVALPRGFAGELEGRRLAGVERQGKSLVVGLDDGRFLVVHLGMTGRFTLQPPDADRQPHDHVLLALDDRSRLVFNDMRRFGRMTVVSQAALPDAVGRGVEPLSPDFSEGFLFGASRKRRTAVKSLLMDQRRVAGLGNIYANELLFHAGVRPRRRAGRLSRRDCARIVSATRAVLEHAIACGGSTISDYRDGFERFGGYQRHHQVYDRTDEPCRRCAASIRRCVIVGRSSYYCPRCQR